MIAAVLELKRLNPRFGCPRIAQQISHPFGLEIDKDVVRRILARHPHPTFGGKNPSGLSAIAEARDSLWSVDLFRCESILLKSFWVMVVMDVFTRRIVGFGVEPAHVDGISVCRMFNQARHGQSLPKRLSSDHDPLFRFHRWIDSPPTSTSGAFTLDWMAGRPSTDAAPRHSNRRIFITSPGDRTVADSSTHQLLRNHEFAMDRRDINTRPDRAQ